MMGKELSGKLCCLVTALVSFKVRLIGITVFFSFIIIPIFSSPIQEELLHYPLASVLAAVLVVSPAEAKC